MLTTVTFTEQEGGLTRVTVAWEPTGDFTKEEVQAFMDLRPDMTMGWTGSFDKLEELL